MLALYVCFMRATQEFSFYCVHERSEGKLTFAQFQNVLKIVAEKKYPGDGNGYKKLVNKVVTGKGPVAAGTTVSMGKYDGMSLLVFWRNDIAPLAPVLLLFIVT